MHLKPLSSNILLFFFLSSTLSAEQYPTVVRIVSSLGWNELNQHHLNSHIMAYTHDCLSDDPSLESVSY